ncbi:antibiotic biosynthesis monooxygenase [Paracraurococcus ruber]|uniref:Antibiotic biosynthesis monooxygenase n=2 Tax=Paracraurococcus ruber TaxID=77675 RepID=A0ABS1D2D4_9PROT|nr:antibiotic biosynthesis monooxygenase [Paracraurococcus ruber]TDG27668.1 antibiotic biosynthesis monooxygenase [Paracraurococcus ruber]
MAAAAAGSPAAAVAARPLAIPPGAVAVLVTLAVRPGAEDAFLRLLHPVLDAMRAEPGFVSAALHRDPADPARFLLHEIWADRQDLVEVQMRRPYRAEYEAQLPALLRRPRAAEVWAPLRADTGG